MFGDIMEIIVGKYSGFCNGVKNTVDRAEEVLNDGRKVFCLGQIVHNERVISDLEKKGLIIVDSLDEVEDNSRIIIRAHGERKEIYDEIEKRGLDLIDLTCGKVKAIRIKVSKEKDNHFIVIIGKKNHPETLGIKSFAENNSIIIENIEDIDELLTMEFDSLYIVSQTTFNEDKFDLLVDEISKRTNKEIIIDKTICNATSNRQEETRLISKDVDMMIIVGGKNSSNTKELEVISKENCNNTYLIQDYNDLMEVNFDSINKIGIMAGASTPYVVVEEIINFLNNV